MDEDNKLDMMNKAQNQPDSSNQTPQSEDNDDCNIICVPVEGVAGSGPMEDTEPQEGEEVSGTITGKVIKTENGVVHIQVEKFGDTEVVEVEDNDEDDEQPGKDLDDKQLLNAMAMESRGQGGGYGR